MTSSPRVNLRKTSSSESLQSRNDSSQQRLSLQHLFNSCVLDKNQRVNAGELIRHFRFVAEQNTDLLNVQIDFAFLLNELGGADQQVSFEQLFSAVEKLYGQLVDPPASKPISSSAKKRLNKENIDDGTATNSFEIRRKSAEHEKCKIERNELMEFNRRQTECLRMLEDEYKKMDEDHQRLQRENEDLQKKKISLEDELSRNAKYFNENVDLHVYKSQLETSLRELKEENECCEKEKFELREQLIEVENQFEKFRDEREEFLRQIAEQNDVLRDESIRRERSETRNVELENRIKENDQTINSLRQTIEHLESNHQEIQRKNFLLGKTIDELRQQLRNAKTESIEARLSISNLCDEESFLCDELEERVDLSRRMAVTNGQSLFAEINTMDNISHECVSQCLDSSHMETSDDMELQILLSKSDSFNSTHLKDLFHELHSHGTNLNEHFSNLIEQIHCDKDRDFLTSSLTTIEKHFSTIKTFIKKLLENKDVFEGRFRKLQTLLLASREKQQKFQNDLKEFSPSISMENLPQTLKDFRQTIEEFQCKEQLTDEKLRSLQNDFTRVQAEEKSQRLKCFFLSKQLKKLSSKTKENDETSTRSLGRFDSKKPTKNFSEFTAGICPFHAVREVLRHDDELFNSTSTFLPCRCLNRSRSSEILSPSDSGWNSSTACSTSRSITPDFSEPTLEIEPIFDETLTKIDSSKQSEKKRSGRTNRSLSTSFPGRSERVRRVLKRLQWCAIITSCSIVLFLWSVVIRYYCLTSPTDDDCQRLSFAWWPFAYCSTNGITL